MTIKELTRKVHINAVEKAGGEYGNLFDLEKVFEQEVTE